MLNLILADSELELIPQELRLHPTVLVHAKRRSKRSADLLLDSSLHHTAMKALADYPRRGRPDLVHTFLLVTLESLLNIQEGLRVLVHTREDKLLRFDPKIRLPKNYNRFVGLIEQLYGSGTVPAATPEPESGALISLEHNRSLGSIVSELRSEAAASGRAIKLIVLKDTGTMVDLREYFRSARDEALDHTCIIGGFPEGDFRSDISELNPYDTISIHPECLKVWTVAAELVVNYRSAVYGRVARPGANEPDGGSRD